MQLPVASPSFSLAPATLDLFFLPFTMCVLTGYPDVLTIPSNAAAACVCACVRVGASAVMFADNAQF